MIPSDPPTPNPSAPGGSRRLIAWNFLTLSGAALAGRVVGLFTGIYTRRVLGVEAIGQLGWCSSFISYFNLLINPGLETIAKRDVARDASLAGRRLSLLLTLQLMLALAAFALVGAFALLKLRGPQISVILALQAVTLLLLPLNLTWLLQARERMAPAAFAEVVSQLLMLPAVVLFVHSPEHVIRYVLLAYPLRIGAIVFLVWYARRNGLFQWREIRLGLTGAVPLLKAAIPLGLSQVSVLLYYNFDTIYLGFTRGDAVVGLYSTAYNLMMVPLFLSGALLNAYFPVLARVHGDLSRMQQVSKEFVRLLVWIGFPLAFLGWAVGSHVVSLLYGSKFAESGRIFEWLCLNVALIFFNVGSGQPFTAWGHQREVFYITILGTVVNVVLNILLIPRYGVWAAVATTILAELVVMGGILYCRQRICPIKWRAIVPAPLAASATTGILVWLFALKFPDFWWGALALGLGLFSFFFWMAEKETVLKILPRLFKRDTGLQKK